VFNVGKSCLPASISIKRVCHPIVVNATPKNEENTMKKIMRVLSMLLGIGGIGMFFLAAVFSLSSVWTISIVTLIVGAVIGLVSVFIEGNKSDNIGSYRIPRL
jgi:hypothetical protein